MNTSRIKISTAISAAILLIAAGGLSYSEWMHHPPAPKPSRASGYYPSEFTLYFDPPAAGQHIYYTLDGSTPGKDSAEYVDGIPIRDKNSDPNVYNAIQNFTYDYEDIDKTGDKPVEKGTVVRALTVSDWGYGSEITTQTYFIGCKTPAENVYVLSAAFDYDDMFGPDGIYVTGREYDEWYLNSDRSGEEPLANFEKHIEIAGILEMLVDNREIVNSPVGIRLQGASKRRNSRKRFIFAAREDYGGSKYINKKETKLFEGADTHSVMLKDSLTDAIIHDLVSERYVSTQQSRPARLYLNGEYWYDTYMLERYDKVYFTQHYGVEEPIIIKAGRDIDGNEDAEEQYDDFITWLEDTDFSRNENWEKLNERADIQSYIDNIIINYYLANWDFCETKNCVLWRSRSSGGEGCRDGRYRWCIYDIDILPGTAEQFGLNSAAELNTFSCEPQYIDSSINENTLFAACRENEQFNKQFVLSFMDMLNNNFCIDRVEKVLREHGADINWERGFFGKRPKFAKEHLQKEFGLKGEAETVIIKNDNPAAGRVIVNTSEIDLSSGSWEGEYFADYPITVTAVPEKGYRFAGWEGSVSSGDETIEVQVDGESILTARFVTYH